MHLKHVPALSILGSEKLLKDPVGNLLSIYKLVNSEFNDKECINFIHEVDQKSTKQHKCIINVSWPTEMSFNHIASNKKAATKNAASKCLQWLHANNKVRHLKPILYDKSEIRTLLKEPTRINLEPEFKNKIESLVDTFDRVSFIHIMTTRSILITLYQF